MRTPETLPLATRIEKALSVNHLLKGIAFCFLLILTSYAHSQLADQKKILVLGDSLSAGYGIPIESAWATLLQHDLKEMNYQVVNASISGETTDGGLRALPALLKEHAPEIVIIELGANDGLRGFPLKTIRQNLSALINQSKAYTDKVLLLGMRIPPNYGNRYAEAFHSLFGELSAKYETALVPFMLHDIAVHSHLMQDDRLHPTSEAQPIIKGYVKEALDPYLKN